MKNIVVTLVTIAMFAGNVLADEGMWIPLLLGNKYNDMKAKGMKLSIEDIYSVNKASLKDAIVIFGRGCTGELVSDKGLLFTNHHCGYPNIQSLSTVEHDYLQDGFWAKNMKEELACPGLTVQFLMRIDDVTDKILPALSSKMTEAARLVEVGRLSQKIAKEAIEGTNYTAVVKPFFGGNQYFLFVYEVYRDVRLVGAPPSSIGKFGGDTDNWMWPRHTGDFSMFRIYANKDNKPADYSPENVPYKPKKHLQISMKGIQENDFTMVLGYPGTTQQFLTSYAIDMIQNKENPYTIEIREKILDIYRADMAIDAATRIKYSAKYASVANYWKKWIGENNGLRRLNTIENKQAQEAEFTNWVNKNNKTEYTNLLSIEKNLYQQITPYNLAKEYIYEALFTPDLFDLVKAYKNATDKSSISETELSQLRQNLFKANENIYKDLNMETDKKIMKEMLKMYKRNVEPRFYPDLYLTIDKKFKGNIDAYVDELYKKSIFANREKIDELAKKYSSDLNKKLNKDPYLQYCNSVLKMNDAIVAEFYRFQFSIDSAQRIYIKALMEKDADKIFYPDANFTMRVTYGQVKPYFPKDGVVYNWFTTLDGVIAKEDADVEDYQVSPKLKELYKNKDYGKYGENGQLKLAFVATNHTTGGNSGSPILNAEGQLIGINFDRSWESTMSDLNYHPEICRNIGLDIKFALFVVDKFAGAGWLLQEMELVN